MNKYTKKYWNNLANDLMLALDVANEHIKKLEEEFKINKADTIRLNWMQSKFTPPYKLSGTQTNGKQKFFGEGNTFREAIDNAMRDAK